MTSVIASRELGNLIGLKSIDGSVVGFHSANLQVARLSPESWDAFLGQDDLGADLALQEWSNSNSSEVKSERGSSGIRALTVNVTQVCNLQCRYCAAGGDGSYGDPQKRIMVAEVLPSLEAFLKRVPRGESFRLTFLGGEPLLYPEGIALLAEESQRLANALGIKIQYSLVTNGTLFNESSVALLARFKMDVTVSLDGPPQVNDRRRPNKAGRPTSSLVEMGLSVLLEQKKHLGTVMLSGVFGADNLDLLSAYHYYRNFEVDWFDFTFDHQEKSSEVSQAYTVQMQKIASLAFDLGGEKELRRIHTFDRWIRTLDSQRRVENYCGAGKSFLMMDAKQNLYTCPWDVGKSQELVGKNASLINEKLVPYQESLVNKHGCQGCFARFICGGGCMYINSQVTGDKHKVDQNYCDRTRILIADVIVYYERMRGT